MIPAFARPMKGPVTGRPAVVALRVSVLSDENGSTAAGTSAARPAGRPLRGPACIPPRGQGTATISNIC